MTEVASAAAVGPPPGLAVRLSSNESPFGPSPAAVQVLRERAVSAHLYPDDASTSLRAAIAREETIAVERVAVGHGSAAVLTDLVAHDARRGDEPGEILVYDRSFIVYRLAAAVVGADLVEAPLAAGYRRDPDALLQRVTPRTRTVLVDNPANPTGAHLTGEELAHLVANLPEDVTVVVDEAYHHFADGQGGYATVGDLDLDHPRLVVVRTFSKAYALAGLRVGYLVGRRDLVAAVDAARVRFNVNSLAQAAAVAALRDRAHLERTITATLSGRQRMAEGLAALEVGVVEGLGNFVLVELGRPAAPVIESYARRGVGVRGLAPYRLDEHVRVTVGTPEEVRVFLDASRDVLPTRA